MLTDHETRPDHDAPRDGETPRASAETHDAQLTAQNEFPTLEEPSWLDDDLDEDMEPPRDSAFRGIWIGVAAAAATFVLVFAIPHWLGWYDLGKPGQRAAREATPESVISTVTAKPSAGAPAEEPRAETTAATAKAAPPAAPAPAVALAPTPAAPTQDAPPKAPARAAPSGPTPVAAKSTTPEKPTKAATASKRTYSVQIAAFKDHKQANRLADRVKRDGYRADVRRVESSAVPWVVRVGGYPSREQAESARDALARKGFRGFVI
jgi:cell division septation protein DedD